MNDIKPCRAIMRRHKLHHKPHILPLEYTSTKRLEEVWVAKFYLLEQLLERREGGIPPVKLSKAMGLAYKKLLSVWVIDRVNKMQFLTRLRFNGMQRARKALNTISGEQFAIHHFRNETWPDWHRNASRNCFWDSCWGRARQLLANFFPLSLLTVPDVFATQFHYRFWIVIRFLPLP